MFIYWQRGHLAFSLTWVTWHGTVAVAAGGRLLLLNPPGLDGGLSS